VQVLPRTRALLLPAVARGVPVKNLAALESLGTAVGEYLVEDLERVNRAGGDLRWSLR